MLESFHAKYPTPFAVLGIRTLGGHVTGIEYLPRGVETLAPLNPLAARACREIERYLDNPEYVPRIPFDYAGTAFQCKVWRQISAIPAGRTLTYVDVARALKTAPRPVGGACGANRIPIVIPCHRVVSVNGIGGFMNSRGADALEIKRWLLRHEGVKVG
ncbi:MAG TPA: methylated-DNA--[protein]-cysteine S-methyltransferase [Burkholderiales bacterium]|nr:methylated-DNA--[protein]-cysteine S-methyltransferase [Burkholderiales bacterium]